MDRFVERKSSGRLSAKATAALENPKQNTTLYRGLLLLLLESGSV